MPCNYPIVILFLPHRYPVFTLKSGVITGHIRSIISSELEALTPKHFGNCQIYISAIYIFIYYTYISFYLLASKIIEGLLI